MTGKEIQIKREQMEMTSTELAEALGVVPETLAQWERDQCEPEHPRMFALALEQLAFQRVTQFKGAMGRIVQQRVQTLVEMNAEMQSWANEHHA
ncbi:MAG: helix-turn-helix domain-containing protein [Acidobacteria bacterium]|nr:helix-turn-helix domain-containing protein [Acidobacteriota bacterium]